MITFGPYSTFDICECDNCNNIKYNVYQHKNLGYEVQVNLAGFNKEDIEVFIKNDKLVIIKRTDSNVATDRKELVKQFNFNQSFELVIPFGFEIESMLGAQNAFKNGILTIHVSNKKEKETKIGFI